MLARFRARGKLTCFDVRGNEIRISGLVSLPLFLFFYFLQFRFFFMSLFLVSCVLLLHVLSWPTGSRRKNSWILTSPCACLCGYVYVTVSERVSEWLSDWVSEWVSASHSSHHGNRRRSHAVVTTTDITTRNASCAPMLRRRDGTQTNKLRPPLPPPPPAPPIFSHAAVASKQTQSEQSVPCFSRGS